MFTDLQLKAIKRTGKIQKVFEGGGFYLYVSAVGSKTFRYDYTFASKRKTLTLGKYPEISLLNARELLNNARKAVQNGTDPMDQKKAVKAAAIVRINNTYQSAYESWLEKESLGWVEEHCQHVKDRQAKYVVPYLGKRALEAITPPEILAVIKKIKSNDLAHRALSDVNRIFRHGIASGVVYQNPARDLSAALPAVKKGNFAAITEPTKLAEFLKSMAEASGSIVTRTGLWFLPRVAVRPIELRQARWADIDLKKATWSYTPQKTRHSTGTALVVPLATQVVAALKDLHPVTGDSEYVFPGTQKSKCLSESTLNVAIIRMGWSREDTTVHGFRATFRTILDEVLGFPIEHIEQQLAHQVRDMHGTAYNRTKHLAQRTHMMQVWADYLDALAEGKDTAEFVQGINKI